MAPPGTAQTGDQQSQAKEKLDNASKLISDLEKKGYDVSEAQGWYDQAEEMFRGGLYKTSLIYSGYAMDVAGGILERIKSNLRKITKVKSRAQELLGEDHKDMPRIDELIGQMKVAMKEGRLDDCQELINAAEGVLRGGTSPYLATESAGMVTTGPSRGYSSCPSCGNIVESSWKECQYCGADLVEDPSSSGPAWTGDVSGPVRVSASSPFDEEESEEEPPAKAPDQEASVDVEPSDTTGPSLGDPGPAQDEGGTDLDEPDMEGSSIPLPPPLPTKTDPTVASEEDTGKAGEEPPPEGPPPAEEPAPETAAEEEPPDPPSGEGKEPARDPGPPSADEAGERTETDRSLDRNLSLLDKMAKELNIVQDMEDEGEEEEEAGSQGPGQVKCPNCGEDVEPEWEKCPVCKAPIERS